VHFCNVVVMCLRFVYILGNLIKLEHVEYTCMFFKIFEVWTAFTSVHKPFIENPGPYTNFIVHI